MRTIKYINYFNLIGGTVLLWTYIRSGPLYYDYYLIVGLGLTIWYNWETSKQLKGQKNRLNKFNYTVGLLTLFFGGLFMFGGLGMIKEGLKENRNVLITLGTIWVPLGLTTIFLTLKTLKIYKAV